MAAPRVRRAGGQALVDADVVEPRLLALEPVVVLLDQLEVGYATSASSCRHCRMRLFGSSSTLAKFEMLYPFHNRLVPVDLLLLNGRLPLPT
jgi:hypothetical protein